MKLRILLEELEMTSWDKGSGPKDKSHSHEYKIDKKGNGETTKTIGKK